MSMRSIVEFNHDYAHRIAEDGPAFACLLHRALSSGGSDQWEKLEYYGIRRAVMTHHSTDRIVIAGGHEFALP